MEINNIEVGKRINNIRLKNGLTMEIFGFRLNTSKGTVNNWEKGRNLPNKENLKKIAELGNVSVNELLHGDLTQYIYKVLSNDLSNFSELYNNIINYLVLDENKANVILLDSEKKSEPYLLKAKTFFNENIVFITDFIKDYIEDDNDIDFIYSDQSSIIRLANLYIDNLIDSLDFGTILNDYTRLAFFEKPKLVKFEELNNQYEFIFNINTSLKTTDFISYPNTKYPSGDYVKLDYVANTRLTFYISKSDRKHQYIFEGLNVLNEEPYQDIFQNIFQEDIFEPVKHHIVTEVLKTEKLKEFNLTLNDLEEIINMDYSKK